MRNMTSPGQKTAIRTLLCLLWGIGIIIGLYKVTAYSNTPGGVLPEMNLPPGLRQTVKTLFAVR